jgi:hypothetical protein
MNAKKLFLAVPVYRDMPAEFFMCQVKLMQANLPFEISGHFLQGQSLVSRARNWLTGDFLATDYTHCLWVDCDIIFTPQDVERLASHDEAIVGGFCPFKKDGELSLAAEFSPDFPPPDERGLLPMRYMGARFLFVRRDVFERMLAAYGDEISYPEPDTRVILKHIGTIHYPATSETMQWDGMLNNFVSKGKVAYGN